ncbi:MAG: DUF2971 domain-containing protein [Candidatus Binataceae bacterium]
MTGNRQARRAMARNVDLQRLSNDIQDQVDQAGILCLCEHPDDLLMWGHYADSHRGVCLEFEVLEKVERLDDPKGFFGRIQPLNYTNSRPVFDPDLTEEKNVENTLLTKSEHWRHEKEWRTIRQAGKGNCVFLPELVTGIILGAKTTEADRKQIRQWAAEGKLNAKFYQAELNDRNWSNCQMLWIGRS